MYCCNCFVCSGLLWQINNVDCYWFVFGGYCQKFLKIQVYTSVRYKSILLSDNHLSVFFSSILSEHAFQTTSLLLSLSCSLSVFSLNIYSPCALDPDRSSLFLIQPQCCLLRKLVGSRTTKQALHSACVPAFPARSSGCVTSPVSLPYQY